MLCLDTWAWMTKPFITLHVGRPPEQPELVVSVFSHQLLLDIPEGVEFLLIGFRFSKAEQELSSAGGDFDLGLFFFVFLPTAFNSELMWDVQRGHCQCYSVLGQLLRNWGPRNKMWCSF